MKAHPMKYLAIAIATFASSTNAKTFSAEVWADNWFALNVNGVEVAQDSVPITTERSFNAESSTFNAQRSFVLGLTAKDFKENDTGLEYIGSRKQQMGDGGVILQIKDTLEILWPSRMMAGSVCQSIRHRPTNRAKTKTILSQGKAHAGSRRPTHYRTGTPLALMYLSGHPQRYIAKTLLAQKTGMTRLAGTIPLI